MTADTRVTPTDRTELETAIADGFWPLVGYKPDGEPDRTEVPPIMLRRVSEEGQQKTRSRAKLALIGGLLLWGVLITAEALWGRRWVHFDVFTPFDPHTPSVDFNRWVDLASVAAILMHFVIIYGYVVLLSTAIGDKLVQRGQHLSQQAIHEGWRELVNRLLAGTRTTAFASRSKRPRDWAERIDSGVARSRFRWFSARADQFTKSANDLRIQARQTRAQWLPFIAGVLHAIAASLALRAWGDQAFASDQQLWKTMAFIVFLLAVATFLAAALAPLVLRRATDKLAAESAPPDPQPPVTC